MLDGPGALCRSCARHAADGHEPAQRGKLWCHGWGPLGDDLGRWEASPRPLAWAETAACVEFAGRGTIGADHK